LLSDYFQDTLNLDTNIIVGDDGKSIIINISNDSLGSAIKLPPLSGDCSYLCKAANTSAFEEQPSIDEENNKLIFKLAEGYCQDASIVLSYDCGGNCYEDFTINIRNLDCGACDSVSFESTKTFNPDSVFVGGKMVGVDKNYTKYYEVKTTGNNKIVKITTEPQPEDKNITGWGYYKDTNGVLGVDSVKYSVSLPCTGDSVTKIVKLCAILESNDTYDTCCQVDTIRYKCNCFCLKLTYVGEPTFGSTSIGGEIE
jgi:hypothetical protein